MTDSHHPRVSVREVWAFAGPRGFAVPNLVERLVLKARGRTHHGSIQVNVGGRTEDWPQQRAALLDEFPTTQIKEEPA